MFWICSVKIVKIAMIHVPARPVVQKGVGIDKILFGSIMLVAQDRKFLDRQRYILLCGHCIVSPHLLSLPLLLQHNMTLGKITFAGTKGIFAFLSYSLNSCLPLPRRFQLRGTSHSASGIVDVRYGRPPLSTGNAQSAECPIILLSCVTLGRAWTSLKTNARAIENFFL